MPSGVSEFYPTRQMLLEYPGRPIITAHTPEATISSVLDTSSIQFKFHDSPSTGANASTDMGSAWSIT